MNGKRKGDDGRKRQEEPTNEGGLTRILCLPYRRVLDAGSVSGSWKEHIEI